MNELLFLLAIFLCLSGTLVFYKLFGKNGLMAFAIFGTLLGNVAVCKCISLFGFDTTCGNVLYASTFLVTDILSEKYGKEEAAKTVKYCFAVMLLWLIASQFILAFNPSESDYVNESFKTVFGLAPRITLASLCGFICSQNLDVFLYHYIHKKTGDNEKKLWIRNNVSTLTSQLLDTVIFTSVAFLGIYPGNIFVSIMITTYVFKAIVAIFDTPFIYLACKLKINEEK